MSSWKSSNQVSTHAHVASGDAAAPAFQALRTVSSLTRLPSRTSRLRKSLSNPVSHANRSSRIACRTAFDRRPVHPVRVVTGLGERGRQALDEDAAPQPAGAVGPDVTGQFPGAEREADQGDLMQIELGQYRVQIPGERVEVVLPRLAGQTARTPGGRT